MFLEDEAAEEEEEGLQAGLGDFGFGVTSNIREHDEEMVSFVHLYVYSGMNSDII